jgi:O-antigen/teichoic acid export membrane protein
MLKLNNLKNGGFYIFSSVFTNLIPVISIAIFTRLLSPADYGAYALSLLYGSFLVSVCNFGLQIGYERDFFEKNQTDTVSGALLYTTILAVLLLTVVVGCVILVFHKFWEIVIFNQSSYGLLFFWAYGYLGLASIKNYFMTYYKNSENAKSFLIFSVSEGVISLSLAYVLIKFLSLGVIGLALSQFIAVLAVLIYMIFRVTEKLKFNLDFNAFKKSFLSSLPLTPKIFFGVISTNLDKILLGKISQLQGLGVYNLGQKIGYVSFTYTVAIYNVFSPRVYKDMFGLGAEGGKKIGSYLTKFFYITIAGILLISLFSEELIIVITPAPYHGAVEIATIFTMLYGIYFFGTIPQLIYAKKTGLTSILSLVYIFLNFVIIYLFIPKWGAIGAAWGSLVSGIIMGGISFFISQKFYRIEWEYSKILYILGLFFSASIILIVLRYYKFSFIGRLGYKCFVVWIYFLLGKKYTYIPSFTFSSLLKALKSRISSGGTT